MKHTAKITTILIILFLLTQFTGLIVIKNYLPKETLPFKIEKPQLKEETSFIPLFITILIATVVALILIKFSAFRLWKLWFFLSIFFTLLIAFAAFIPELVALILALILTIIRIFRPNVIIHNLTEVFIYGGLAAIFVPVLSILSITILLILISYYDMIAVWKTKHMIKLAKFQTRSRLFAGLLIPYKMPKRTIKEKLPTKIKPGKTAILGGGDMGFPLLFSGVVLKTSTLLNSIIVVIITALSLFLLFYFAEKKKFYPAMPFLSLGCLVGYIITLLV